MQVDFVMFVFLIKRGIVILFAKLYRERVYSITLYLYDESMFYSNFKYIPLWARSIFFFVQPVVQLGIKKCA